MSDGANVRRTWIVLVVGAVVAVPAWTAGSTALAFARGTARVASVGAGYPSPEGSNLDPLRRAFPQHLGCNPELVRSLRARLERATFDALFEAFGPMPHAYLGAYPREAEAFELVALRGAPLTVRDGSRGELALGGQSVTLDARSFERLKTSGQALDLRGVLMPKGPLLVGANAGALSTVSLFDVGGIGWFATYRRGP